MNLPEPKDFPMVSFRMTGIVDSEVLGMKKVLIDVSIDRPLNGYHGDGLSLNVPIDMGCEELTERVLGVVHWTLKSRTGLPFPKSNVKDLGVSTPVTPDAPVEIVPPAPPVQVPEPTAQIVEEPAVIAPTTFGGGDEYVIAPDSAPDGPTPPVEGEAVQPVS